MSAFLDTGPVMVEWMENNTSMKWVGIPAPDYHMDIDGAVYGRTMMTKPFDGRLLGRLVRDVRYPLQGMCAFGSMQTDLADINKWKSPFGSWSNFKFCTQNLARYGVDRVRYGKGTALYNGNALVGRLLHSADRAGVTLWNNAPADQVILQNGRNVGLVIAKNGKRHRVQARRGIVFATGGFSRSVAMSRKYLPNADWTAAPRGNTGDGIRIGLQGGGTLPEANPDNAIWSPISQFQPKRGPVRNFPHLALDRSKPGSIIVDGDGKRFANESEPYQPFGCHTHAAGIRKEFLVGDHDFLRTYGMGVALPRPYPLFHILRRGYLLHAPTIPALAQKMGVDPKAFSATVDRFNQYAREGKDLDFHRGESIYDQGYGDPAVKPNPSLAPIVKPPFYALPMYPGNIGSIYGLKTNADAQLLDESGNIIPGLYAVGADQNSVMRGRYPGGGCCIGPGMVFGYRAGMHLAKSR